MRLELTRVGLLVELANYYTTGELLKVNTANWPAFPFKYKVFDKFNTSIKKTDSELPCLG